MNVNLSPNEYMIVCRVADYHGSYPAQLAHEWICNAAARELAAILAQRGDGEGMLGTGGDPSPSQASRAVPGREG